MNRFIAFVVTIVAIDGAARAQDPVQPLLKKLDSKKSDARFDALMALADLGPSAGAATDRLIHILKGFDEVERTLATVVLGKIGKPALPALATLLNHEDEAVRYNAVWALGMAGADAQANVQRLLKLFERDPDVDVRGKAAFALTRIAPAHADTLAALAAVAAEEKTPLPLRLIILGEIRHCGEPAILILGRALKDIRTYDIAQQSLKHLLEKHTTKSAAEAMLPFVEIAYAQAIAHPAPLRARRQNAPVISDLCDGAGMSHVIATVRDQVIAPIEQRLQSKDAAVRAAASTILGNMGHTLRSNRDAPDLVDRIVKALLPAFQDPDATVRLAVVESIPPTKASVAAQRAAVMDANVRVRRSACFSLWRERFDVMASLRERFVKVNGKDLVLIACALATCEHDKDALAFLWKHLAQLKGEFRHQAAYTLGSNQALTVLKPEELKKLALPVLMESLKSADPVQRVQAAEALSVSFWLLDEKHVPALIAALKDRDPSVRQHIVAALRTKARDTRKDILPAVQPFLRDPDPQTQIYAIHCFGHTGKAGVGELIKLLETEKQRVVRNQVMTSLQQPNEPAAVEALFKAAANAEDQDHALDALWRVGEKRTFPRSLEILRKQDRKIDQAFAEMKAPPALIVDAALALTPLLQREELAVNRRAVHSIAAISKILWADTAIWMMPLQRAIEKRLLGLKPSVEAKDKALRLEAVEFLGELRALERSIYFHITSRTDAKLRPEMDDLWHKNHQAIDDLLNLARRDDELSIRRAARRGMVTLTPLDGSR